MWGLHQMLPGMNAKFERYIQPAKPPAGGWLLLGGVCFILIAYTIGSFLILGAVAFLQNSLRLDGIDAAMGAVTSQLRDADDPVAILLLLVTFVGMAAAVLLATRLFHDRGLMSLLGPHPWRLPLSATLKGLAPFLAVALIGGFVMADPRPNMPLPQWLLLMVPALPLLLIQVLAEELIFRGYLMQELAVRARTRWVWFVLPAVVFGSLHFDTETFSPTNAVLVVVATTLFGLIAGDVTIRTGSLIPAIVLHFMNNLLAMMILSLDGTLNGLSLFVTGVSVEDDTQVTALLLADIAFLALAWLAWMWFASRRARLHSTGEAPTWAPDAQGPRP